MASNSIFDTFSSYSPSLLRGKSPVVAFPSLLLCHCVVQKASFGSCNVHVKSIWCVYCSVHECLLQFSSCERVTVHACMYVGLTYMDHKLPIVTHFKVQPAEFTSLVWTSLPACLNVSVDVIKHHMNLWCRA